MTALIDKILNGEELTGVEVENIVHGRTVLRYIALGGIKTSTVYSSELCNLKQSIFELDGRDFSVRWYWHTNLKHHYPSQVAREVTAHKDIPLTERR